MQVTYRRVDITVHRRVGLFENITSEVLINWVALCKKIQNMCLINLSRGLLTNSVILTLGL
jgi:hypothetical protein